MSAPAEPPAGAEAAAPPPRRLRTALAVLLVVGLYGGMITTVRAARMQPDRAAPMAMADDVTSFAVDRLPADVAAHYRHAAAHPDVYRDVPCYCGCDTFADHANLLDCFVRDDGGDEPHAAGCGICLAEAGEVRDLLAAGRTAAQVRDAVIEKFGPTTNPAAA